jgi:hypothetical protein
MWHMSVRILLFIVSVDCLTGCVALKQFDANPAWPSDGFTLLDSHTALIQFGPLGHDKGTVIDIDSHAVMPDGTWRRVGTRPHPYDLTDMGTAGARSQLFLVNRFGRLDCATWPDGEWRFVLTVARDGSHQVHTFDVRLWTMYYSPLVHGPPN